MPYLSVQTNCTITESDQTEFLAIAAERISSELEKSERYFMGAIRPPGTMRFDATDDPTAFFELAAIGLPEEKTEPLSRLLCELAETHLNIPQDRVYVRFQNSERNMWGWNGKTFA